KGFMVRKAPDPHPFLPRSTFLAPRVTAIAGYNGQIKQFRPEQPHARCRELATTIAEPAIYGELPHSPETCCAPQPTARPPASQPARQPASPAASPLAPIRWPPSAGRHPLAAIRWPPSARP